MLRRGLEELDLEGMIEGTPTLRSLVLRSASESDAEVRAMPMATGLARAARSPPRSPAL